MKKSCMRVASSAISLCFLMMLSIQVSAVTIVDTASIQSYGSFTLGQSTYSQDPLGQAFVLDQAYDNLMIGGVLDDVNAWINPTFDITISLFSGAGVTGTLLGLRSVTLPDGFSSLHTEDFSFLGVLAAGTYTAAFSSGNTKRGALAFVDNNPYTLGAAYNEDGVFDLFNVDMDFAVLITGDVSTVPIPASVWLFGSGLLGLVGMARRKAY